MSAKDGGPAFPIHCNYHDVDHSKPGMINGLSLRDYFATAALHDVVETDPEYVRFPIDLDKLAKRCYAVADAMLAERVKERE